MKSLIIFILLIIFCYGQCPAGTTFTENWMERLASQSAPVGDNTFATSKLNNIFMIGSHDAGMYDIPGGFTMQVTRACSINVTQTQNVNIGDQLCQGMRLFDMRFRRKNNQWITFHGKPFLGVGGYGETLPVVAQQLKTFLDNHPSEVVIWRLRIEGWKYSQTKKRLFVTDFRNELSSYMYEDAVEPKDASLTDILWHTHNTTGPRGALVALYYKEFPKSATDRNPVGAEGRFYKYGDNMMGKFSSAQTLSAMLKVSLSGQVNNLNKYKRDLYGPTPNLDRPLFGFWWTYTLAAGDAIHQRDSIINLYNSILAGHPTGFNDAYCELSNYMGNVVWVDFHGERLMAKAQADVLFNSMWSGNMDPTNTQLPTAATWPANANHMMSTIFKNNVEEHIMKRALTYGLMPSCKVAALPTGIFNFRQLSSRNQATLAEGSCCRLFRSSGNTPCDPEAENCCNVCDEGVDNCCVLPEEEYDEEMKLPKCQLCDDGELTRLTEEDGDSKEREMF